MSDDYSTPYQRKSKRDMLRKRKQRVYKRGGTFRGVVVRPKDSGEQDQNESKK